MMETVQALVNDVIAQNDELKVQLATAEERIRDLKRQVNTLVERCRFDELNVASIEAIRTGLCEANVPEAAFIDDFVGNAVAQRNQYRELAKIYGQALDMILDNPLRGSVGCSQMRALAKDALAKGLAYIAEKNVEI